MRKAAGCGRLYVTDRLLAPTGNSGRPPSKTHRAAAARTDVKAVRHSGCATFGGHHNHHAVAVLEIVFRPEISDRLTVDATDSPVQRLQRSDPCPSVRGWGNVQVRRGEAGSSPPLQRLFAMPRPNCARIALMRIFHRGGRWRRRCYGYAAVRGQRCCSYPQILWVASRNGPKNSGQSRELSCCPNFGQAGLRCGRNVRSRRIVRVCISPIGCAGLVPQPFGALPARRHGQSDSGHSFARPGKLSHDQSRAGPASERQRLDDEFSFAVGGNKGGKHMAAADVERLESIGTQTRWRTPNDCVGISRGELQDTSRTPAPRLPALGIPLVVRAS